MTDHRLGRANLTTGVVIYVEILSTKLSTLNNNHFQDFEFTTFIDAKVSNTASTLNFTSKGLKTKLPSEKNTFSGNLN